MNTISYQTHAKIPLIDFAESPFYDENSKDIVLINEGLRAKISYIFSKVLLFIQSHNVFADSKRAQALRNLVAAEENMSKYERSRLLNSPIEDKIIVRARQALFTHLHELAKNEFPANKEFDALCLVNNLKSWRWDSEDPTAASEANSDVTRVIAAIIRFNPDYKNLLNSSFQLSREMTNYLSSDHFITPLRSSESNDVNEFNKQVHDVRQEIRKYRSFTTCVKYLLGRQDDSLAALVQSTEQLQALSNRILGKLDSKLSPLLELSL